MFEIRMHTAAVHDIMFSSSEAARPRSPTSNGTRDFTASRKLVLRNYYKYIREFFIGGAEF